MKKTTFNLSIILCISLCIAFAIFLSIQSPTIIRTSTNNTVAKVGWVTEDGKEYYYDPVTHQKYSGWLREGESTYYLDPITKEKKLVF